MVLLYKTKKITKSTCIGFKCDICKKEFGEGINIIRVATGHHDWGTDSIDSIYNYDICSMRCFINGLKSGMIKFEENSETSYLNIDTELNGEDINYIKNDIQI